MNNKALLKQTQETQIAISCRYDSYINVTL